MDLFFLLDFERLEEHGVISFINFLDHVFLQIKEYKIYYVPRCFPRFIKQNRDNKIKL